MKASIEEAAQARFVSESLNKISSTHIKPIHNDQCPTQHHPHMQAVAAATTPRVMELDPPHVHAPELFHPEEVTCTGAAATTVKPKEQQQESESNVGVKATVRAAVNNAMQQQQQQQQQVSEDAREGKGVGVVGRPMPAVEKGNGMEEGTGELTPRDLMFYWSG